MISDPIKISYLICEYSYVTNRLGFCETTATVSFPSLFSGCTAPQTQNDQFVLARSTGRFNGIVDTILVHDPNCRLQKMSAYCNTLLYEWKIKEPRKHLNLIVVDGGTKLPKITRKISRSVKILLYAIKKLCSAVRGEGGGWNPSNIWAIYICLGSKRNLGMWMAVYREHGPGSERINVGQITIMLSLTLWFFVKYGGNISAKVRQKNYQASNLEQNGGLKFTITVHDLCNVRFSARKDNS